MTDADSPAVDYDHDASLAVDYDHDASLAVDYDDPDSARVVARSVRREVDEIDGDRSRAAVARDGATLTVEVAASDLVGLRAGLNTWLGLVGVAERTAEVAERAAGDDG